ncbi:MAG: serine hydrolase domain-containing protein [Bacteroidota bacterium]
MKNKKLLIIRILLLVGTSISLWFVPWPIVTAWIKPLPDTIQAQVNKAADYGFDGIIVYVDQKGKAPAWYTAGWHNTEQQIPAKPNALFKIASISKLYNAVSIAKLVASNKLSLDGTLAEYFPEFADRIENSDQITLKMLVQHRSGIPNFTETPNFWNESFQNSQEVLELIFDLPANFAPDTDYEYSNTNYLLISMLIEKVTGMPRFQYMKETFLASLGLHNTFGSIKDISMNDLMSGYYVGIEKDMKTTDYGSMIATAQDVGTFLRSLNDGSIFQNGEQEIYTSIYVYDHTGLIPGYQSIAKYHEDIDAVVIQFTNTTNFLGYNWNLSEVMYNRVVKILRNE